MARTVKRSSKTVRLMRQEQFVCSIHGFGAKRTLPNSFVIIKGKNGGREKMYVRRVKRLFRFLMKGDIESYGLASEQYMEYLLPSDPVDELCGMCVCSERRQPSGMKGLYTLQH